MRKYRWFTSLMAAVLLVTALQPVATFASDQRSLQDESIYDLLVDRYNNGNFTNDEGTDVKDPATFSGGDFAGITERVLYLAESGFTIASIGSVFKSTKYDGNEVLSYEAFEPRFGEEKEFVHMISVLKENSMGTIVDFPLNGISDEHEWIKDDSLPATLNDDGTANWVETDVEVQAKLKETIVSFVKKYDLAGIRLTHLGNFDDAFLNAVIAEIKAVNDTIYVITNETSTANFDSMPNQSKMEALKQSYVQIDPDSSILKVFEDQNETDLIQLDELTGPRFTYEMTQLRMFPPTRWKIAATALFTLPGVPILPYQSEIAVTGKEAPESHPLTNFKTETELYDHIANLNKLRNESDTLRNGDFKLLHNEDGFTVYMRTSDEEKWVIALNNTSETKSLEIDEKMIGENQKLRGLIQQELIKQDQDGQYRVVLERELAEVYYMEEDTGYNIPYLIATVLIYTSFFGFLFMMFRRARKNKAA